MKSFQFPLDRALAVRGKQLELAQAAFQKAAAALAAVDRERASLTAAQLASENGLENDARRAGVPGEELNALEGFRLGVESRQRRLTVRRQQATQTLETRRLELLEARRRSELLQRLRARRYAEWRAEADREIEAAAAESYLARWSVKMPGDAQTP